MPLITRPLKTSFVYIDRTAEKNANDEIINPSLTPDGEKLTAYSLPPNIVKHNISINKNNFAYFKISNNPLIGSSGLMFVPGTEESLRIRSEILSSVSDTDRENIEYSTLIPVGVSTKLSSLSSLITVGDEEGINLSGSQYGLNYYTNGENSFNGNYEIINISTKLNVLSYNTEEKKFTTNTDNEIIIGNVVTFTQEQIESQTLESNIKGNQAVIPEGLVDFRKTIWDRLKNNPTATTSSVTKIPNTFVDYAENNIEKSVKLGDPGSRVGKDISNYDTGYAKNALGAASPNSFDEINASSIGSIKNDLCQFVIGTYDYKGGFINLQFRAYLDSISDDYSADWKGENFIGRGEKFYTYSGFDRRISLSWTVAAQSRRELSPMYKKLNYLASICAPNYTNGYMRGNISKLRIGDYIGSNTNPLYGIITKVAFELSEDSPWEINITSTGRKNAGLGEVPHMIKVKSFEFIPIHSEVPRLGNRFIADIGTGEVPQN